MEKDETPLTPFQAAYNDGIEAAKTIIREHPTEDYCEFDYWRASLINAIARKTNPYAYVRQDIADERVRVARREVWDAAVKAVDGIFLPAIASVEVINQREGLLLALRVLDEARAAEGE